MAITKAAQRRIEAREAALARRAAQSEGGQTSWANREPDDALAARRKAAAAVNGPAGLARRIAKPWPDLGEAEQAEVRAILAGAGITPPPLAEAVVTAVARTLRQLAGWSDDDRAPADLYALAVEVENPALLNPADLASVSCPMCQELICDDDCPLAQIRVRAERG